MPTFPTYRDELPKCISPFNLQHYCLLAYWVYFRPTVFKSYLYQANPELYQAAPGLKIFQILRIPAYRNLYLTMPVISLFLSLLVGLPLLLVSSWQIGETVNWVRWILGVAIGVVLGAFISLVFTVIFGAAASIARGMGGMVLCVDVGVAAGILFGVVLGLSDTAEFQLITPNSIPVGIACGLAVGVTVALAIGEIVGLIVGLIFGVCIFLLLASMFSIIANGISSIANDDTAFRGLSLAYGSALGFAATGIAPAEINFGRSVFVSATICIAFGFALVIIQPEFSQESLQIGIAGSFVSLLGIFRIIPFFFPIHFLAVILYRWFPSIKHPAEWDEILILPLPGTERILTHHLKRDRLNFLLTLAGNPFQRWVVQRALKAYLQKHPLPLNFLYELLSDPRTEHFVFAPITQMGWQKLPSIKQLLLGELNGKWVDCTTDITSRLLERLIYSLTWLWRDRTQTPLTDFAGFLYQLLDETTVDATNFDLAKYRSCYVSLTNYPNSGEIERSFEVMASFLACNQLSDFPEAIKTASDLPPPETAMRPIVMEALSRLREIGTHIVYALNTLSWRNKQDTFSIIPKKLNDLDAYMAEEVVTPEKSLLRRIIRQWSPLIDEELERIGSRKIEGTIPNPYIAGNPVTGELFFGREDILQELKELWEKPGQCPSVVLYGHRRMGKSSILQNLKYYFDSQTVIIDFNMQFILELANTGQLLYLLASEISYQFSKVQPNALENPLEEHFISYPARSFRRFLDKLDSVRDGRKFIVTVDEFEILEEMLNEKQLNPNLIEFWRGLFQTYQWFIMAFAGLHTLEEMSHNYWNPLYGSVNRIPISFLKPYSARQLIEDPIPIDYTPEAVEEIINLTNGQPYLIQLICHTLVYDFNCQVKEEKEPEKYFTLDNVETVINSPELFRDGIAYFDGVWVQAKSQPEGQIEILRQLCQEELSAIDLVEKTGFSMEKIQDALGTLVRHDVIEKCDNNSYKYTVELMRRWVEQQEPA